MVYNNGSCPVTASPVAITFINPPPAIPQITQIGNLLSCGQGSVTLSTNTSGAALTWSTGATSASITVTQGGSYYVTANYGQGCQSTSQTLNLNASSVSNPGICMVTVDSLTNSNRIVWEKPVSNEIDSFYVYKEGDQANIYTRIASIAYSQLSEFNDVNSNPLIRGYRYKLGLRDTCGGISALSAFHKTIHLQIFPGTGNSRQLSWSHYEGINFVSYEILRKLPGQGYQLLATLPSNLNTYTDLNPVSADADYKVEVVLPQVCVSVARMEGAYGRTRSNVGNNQAILLVPQGINENKIFGNLHLFPNPASSYSEVFFESESSQTIQVDIKNISGQLIRRTSFQSLSGMNKFRLENSSPGMYFIELSSADSQKVVLKWMIQ
jgi:hypothetical protein